MFDREVPKNLRHDRQTSLVQTLVNEIIHVVGRDNAFGDEMTFVSRNGGVAVGISFLKAMDQVVEGTPQVKPYEISNSTWHKIAALKPA